MKSKQSSFPEFIPPAVDDAQLRRPTQVHLADVEPRPLGTGGVVQRSLLDETTADCRLFDMRTVEIGPGQSTPWLTHPHVHGEEAYIYVCSGRGRIHYLQGRKEQSQRLETRSGIFPGHRSYRLVNEGRETLVLLENAGLLPRRTLIHEVDDPEAPRQETADHPPPTVINYDDVPEIYPFPGGGAKNRLLITPERTGCRHAARFGIYEASPGLGSMWHTHPLETGEEDLFYILHGEGTMVYLQDGKEHRFDFAAGDAIHSHHLTNYTFNRGSSELFILFINAPNPTATIKHRALGETDSSG